MRVVEHAELPGVFKSEQREQPGLKQRVFRAGGWTLVGHFLSLSLRLMSSIVLTRIFSPGTFGFLAIITAVTAIIGLLTDIGLRQAVVRSPNGGNPTFLNTAWSLQILRGILVWGLCVIVAGGLHFAAIWRFFPMGSVYTQPGLPGLIVMSSFSAVIMGFQSMKTITASRDLNLRRVTLLEIISQLFGLILILLLGWLTRSIWSYMFGLLMTAALMVALGHLWLQGPRDHLAWDKEALHELRHFGKWIFLSSAIGATILNGDRMLLAAWLNPATLGFYSLANNLASVADAVANSLFGSVVMPTLSEVNRSQPERIAALFSRIRWLSDSLLLFVAGFLFASGAAIVGLLYDPRYSSAGWMLQWLSFSLVLVRYNISGSAYLALGRPQYITAINMIRSVSLLVFLAAGFYGFGVFGAIIGIAFHMVPAALFILYYDRQLQISNLHLECFVLLVWPVGWLAGTGFNELVVVTQSYFIG
jgi:O-antigen/teichoic acid export membrane protein